MQRISQPSHIASWTFFEVAHLQLSWMGSDIWWPRLLWGNESEIYHMLNPGQRWWWIDHQEHVDQCIHWHGELNFWLSHYHEHELCVEMDVWRGRHIIITITSTYNQRWGTHILQVNLYLIILSSWTMVGCLKCAYTSDLQDCTCAAVKINDLKRKEMPDGVNSSPNTSSLVLVSVFQHSSKVSALRLHFLGLSKSDIGIYYMGGVLG